MSDERTRFTVRMEQPLYEKLAATAKEDGRSINAEVSYAVKEMLEKGSAGHEGNKSTKRH